MYIYTYIQHTNIYILHIYKYTHSMQIYFIAATVKSKGATKYLEQLILFKLAVVQAIGVKSVAFECKTEELHLI